MKESIKKRIEAVRRGEVPEGYRIENGYLISDDWKTIPLNSRFTRSTRKNSTGCENVLTISAQMGLVNQREFYDKDIASEDKSGYFLMKNGEFAYNKSYSTGYPYGAIKQLTKYDEGIVSPLYICFVPKAGTNTAFYTQYFEGGQYNREIYRVAQEGARNHGLMNIAVDDFFTGTLVEPSAGEQQKIAKILATCDRMIELKQGKIDELNKLKQVCLLEMFPQKGQTIPQRRFPGFSAPWEQRKLGDIAPLRGGFAFKSNEYCSDGVPIVRISNILLDGSVGADFAYYDEQKSDEMYTLYNGAVVLAMSGATTGKVSVLCAEKGQKYYQNQRVGYFIPTDNCDYGLIKTITRSQLFADQLAAVLVAGAQPNVSSKEIDEFEFMIPKSKDEQHKMGDYFSKLDHLITLHQRELAEVGKYKKALMQLLLTGLVRVNA